MCYITIEVNFCNAYNEKTSGITKVNNHNICVVSYDKSELSYEA